MFRDRGCECGHDPACFLKHAQLQRDGGANDFFLPLEGDSQAACPFCPILPRALFPVARDHTGGIRQGFIRPQNEGRVAIKNESRFRENIGNRRIRCHSESKLVIHKADMIDTANRTKLTPPPIGFRPHRNAQLRRACDHFKSANDAGRAEHAPLVFEPRGEIDNLDNRAIFRFHPCTQDCRVAIIGLATLCQAFHPDIEGAIAAQQLVEHGLPVKSGQAEPLIVPT